MVSQDTLDGGGIGSNDRNKLVGADKVAEADID